MNLTGTEAQKPAMFQYEYARAALERGLALEQTLGANPFEFGMIGSTDSHVGISAVASLTPRPRGGLPMRAVDVGAHARGQLAG